MNRLAKQIDHVNAQMHRAIGKKAVYVKRMITQPDGIAASPVVTEQRIPVQVQRYPINQRDLIELSKSGLETVTSQWVIRTAEIASVSPQDRIEVDGEKHQVVSSLPAQKDEFGLTWRVMTRRVDL